MTETDERQVAEKRQDAGTGVSNVAARYASALFEVARDQGAIDVVLRDLDTFDRMLTESPDLARLVRSPVFAAEDQVRAVGAIVDRAGISGLAANIVRLVASKRRLFVLPA
jgi:F-type H+-transporting ATPase subunit delta